MIPEDQDQYSEEFDGLLRSLVKKYKEADIDINEPPPNMKDVLEVIRKRLVDLNLNVIPSEEGHAMSEDVSQAKNIVSIHGRQAKKA